MLELDYNAGHIVATKSSVGSNVRCDDLFKHVLNTLTQFLLFLQLFSNEVSGFLICETVPDSITGHNHKFHFFGEGVFFYFGVCGDHLILRGQVGILFVLQISKRPTQVEHSLNSVFLYEPSCLFNSSFLSFVVGFMIITHFNSLKSTG
jgi:hypothetical protein